MNNARQQLIAILEELERRKACPAPSMIDPHFQAQADFIEDQSLWKAALCTRRAGKSEALGRMLFDAALSSESVSALYFGLTRKAAKAIMWRDIVLRLNRHFKIGGKPNQSELSIYLPNGSDVSLHGLDSSKDQIDKFLGGKPVIAVFDECGSFRQDLEAMVHEYIGPALADHGGQTVLAGTPTDLLNTYFHRVTDPDHQDHDDTFSMHRWTWADNPYIKEKMQERIDAILKRDPRAEETPRFRRMYRGLWAVDDDKLVYRYKPGRNDIDALPGRGLNDFTNILGVDLGYNDATSIVPMGWRDHDSRLFIHEAFKQTEMNVTQTVAKIRWFAERYDPTRIVIDPASKQVVKELQARFTLPLTSAEKSGKEEFISLMNADFETGIIQLLPPTGLLREEYGSLIWDDRASKRAEHPSCENHCADAALYGWRYCRQYLATPKPEKLTGEEEMDAWWEAHREEEQSDIPWYLEGMEDT